jgi:hypothetical protein
MASGIAFGMAFSVHLQRWGVGRKVFGVWFPNSVCLR